MGAVARKHIFLVDAVCHALLRPLEGAYDEVVLGGVEGLEERLFDQMPGDFTGGPEILRQLRRASNLTPGFERVWDATLEEEELDSAVLDIDAEDDDPMDEFLALYIKGEA